jgi:hypothetical protein
VRGLSLTQPWASLVAVSAKKIETRSWPTSYRGEIAIHASKEFPRAAVLLCFDDPFRAALFDNGIATPGDLPRGAIVAVAQLVACFPTSILAWSEHREGFQLPGEPEQSFGNYEVGRFMWRFENIRRLHEPIQAKGSLGLWDVPPDAVDAIYSQIKGAA